MKYIKPHLSPELRAQITPHTRRDVKLTSAGVIFVLASVFLAYNLWPKSDTVNPNNNKATAVNTQQKEVLGATTHVEDPAPVAPTQAPSDFSEYTVKNGDTLFNISQQYNIRWDLLAQINSLTEPYVLHAGQVIKIPQSTTSKIPGKIYTIKAGDTLASIARSFNITVDDIIAVNPNLQKSDLITVGQVIKLP